MDRAVRVEDLSGIFREIYRNCNGDDWTDLDKVRELYYVVKCGSIWSNEAYRVSLGPTSSHSGDGAVKERYTGRSPCHCVFSAIGVDLGLWDDTSTEGIGYMTYTSFKQKARFYQNDKGVLVLVHDATIEQMQYWQRSILRPRLTVADINPLTYTSTKTQGRYNRTTTYSTAEIQRGENIGFMPICEMIFLAQTMVIMTGDLRLGLTYSVPPGTAAVHEKAFAEAIRPVIEGVGKTITSAKVLSESQRAALLSFVSRYFSSAHLRSVRTHCIYRVAQTLDPRLALTGAGPMMLKILQRLSGILSVDDQESLLLYEMVQQTFSNVAPCLDKEFLVVCSHFEVDVNEYKRDPIAVASIGQVHLGSNTVLKFLRPRSAMYFEAEKDFIEKELVDVEELDEESIGFLREIVSLTQEEFDFEKEKANSERAAKVYAGYVNVPKVHLCQKAAGDSIISIMVQDLANGATMHNIVESSKCKGLYQAMYGFVGTWFREAVMGSGFIHADAHPGNVLWDSETSSLWLIDYGNCATLSAASQKKLRSAIYHHAKKNWARLLLGLCGEGTKDVYLEQVLADKDADFSGALAVISQHAAESGSGDSFKCDLGELTAFGTGLSMMVAGLMQSQKCCGLSCTTGTMSNIYDSASSKITMGDKTKLWLSGTVR